MPGSQCKRMAPWRRLWTPALLLGALAIGVPMSRADPDTDRRPAAPGLSAQDRAEDLVVCYAQATDRLGGAVNAVGNQPLESTVNLADADFAAALAQYRRCFAPDFTFTLLVNGELAVEVPDPVSRTPETDAALQWANFVNNAFRAPGYRNTQHHMGSISSELSGARGTVQSFLIATHMFGPASAYSGVNVVTGVYDDVVVLREGRWLIESRTLDITSSVLIPQEL